jgi:hypothetical protein
MRGARGAVIPCPSQRTGTSYNGSAAPLARAHITATRTARPSCACRARGAAPCSGHATPGRPIAAPSVARRVGTIGISQSRSPCGASPVSGAGPTFKPTGQLRGFALEPAAVATAGATCRTRAIAQSHHHPPGHASSAGKCFSHGARTRCIAQSYVAPGCATVAGRAIAFGSRSSQAIENAS